MKFDVLTKNLIDLLEEILIDIPKSANGNKSASQRIRVKTIRLTKLTRDWRKSSLNNEKKEIQRNRKRKK